MLKRRDGDSVHARCVDGRWGNGKGGRNSRIKKLEYIRQVGDLVLSHSSKVLIDPANVDAWPWPCLNSTLP